MITLDQITYDLASIQIISSSGNALAISPSGSLTVLQDPNSTPWIVSDLSDGSVNGGTAGTKSQLGGAIYNSSPLTLTNGQQASLQFDSGANLLVNLKTALPAGSNVIGSVNQGTSPWITKDQSDGPVAPGTVATYSKLSGGQYVAAGVTLTDQQQAALQLDSAGKLLVKQNALVYSSDSVAIKGSTGNQLVVNADGSLNVQASEAIFTAWKATQQSASTSASQVAATSLANRKRIIVQNLGSQDIYIGTSAAVTTANGLKVPKGANFEDDLGASVAIYMLTPSGTSDVRIAEFA
jgi:hypothetical protein